MTPGDREIWARVTNLREFGEVTAQWLEGKIGSRYAYEPDTPPDDETESLIPILVALNRAGIVTDTSQPGQGDATDGQRAAVDGFINAALVPRLREAADRAGLVALTYDPNGTDESPIVCTMDEGKEFTWFGYRQDLEDLLDEFPNLLAVARTAWQFTIVDLDWGRNDRLWRMLEALARDVSNG